PARSRQPSARLPRLSQRVTDARRRHDCCHRSAGIEPSRTSMTNDIRIAVRNLIRVPGFACAFVLTLGLGIGANTPIFSVINGVILPPLPYPEADRIMHLRQPQTAAGVE